MKELYRAKGERGKEREEGREKEEAKKPARPCYRSPFFGAAVFTILLAATVLLFSFFLAPLLSQENRYVGKIVSDVEFQGLRNFSAQEIYELITTRIDQPLERRAFNADVKALFNSGYFSNVVMRARLLTDDTLLIIYDLQERPLIDEIEFIGIEELVLDDILSQLPAKQGEVLIPRKVKEGLKTVKRLYIEGGFPFVEVWYRISPVDPIENHVTVFYIIDEGDNIPVAHINIVGIRHIDPDDIRNILEHKESTTFEEGIFQEGKYEEDKFKILAYLKSQGYLSAEIDPQATGYELRWRNPQDPEEGRVAIITYAVIEGELKYFGGYSLEHDPTGYNKEFNPPEKSPNSEREPQPIFPPQSLLAILNYSDADIGDIFNEQQYFMDRASLQEQYAGRGYVFAQIGPKFVNFNLNEETISRYERCLALKAPRRRQDILCKQEASWLNLKQLREQLASDPTVNNYPLRHVHFTIRENDLAHIENIIIKGNQKTEEYVIRREILIKEGQLFNFFLVNESRRRLINLNYFKEVNLQTLPSSTAGKMNLIFEVEEQPTGTISMGGGYGTNSGFSIFSQVGESNLAGKGQGLSTRLEYGPLLRSLSVRWNDPWFYESCQSSTGSFWRNKLKAFENARDFADIASLAIEFQNEYEELGKEIGKYLEEAGDRESIETLDGVKEQIRLLLADYVIEEEDCYNKILRPWSLVLGASISSFRNSQVDSINDELFNTVEDAEYQSNSFGFTIGTSHRLGHRWSHYHYYRPSFLSINEVSSLASDSAFQRQQLGTQFKSSLLNGLAYSSLDRANVPTEGLRNNFEIELVGNLLGGADHFNRYTITTQYYFWWLDYTFGGLFRSRNLRRWRVVQQFRFRSTFSHETSPYYSDQRRERNPYIEINDRLYLGGTGSSEIGSLRGYQPNNSNFPIEWANGANHLVTYGTELRFPIEPSLVWFILFLDAGSLYDNLGDYRGTSLERLENYRKGDIEISAATGQRGGRFTSPEQWNDPRRLSFSRDNIALDRFLYSWGYGFRLEIPVFPLRIYFAQKLYYNSGVGLRSIPGDGSFDLVLGLGDIRF